MPLTPINPCGLPSTPYDKLKDPYRFVKVEEFFSDLDENPESRPNRIENVQLYPYEDDKERQIAHHGAAFRDDQNKVFLIQFIRPTVFRVRFNPERTSLTDYSDGNTRNVVQNSLEKLIAVLDQFENIQWKVVVEEIVKGGVKYVKIESRPEEGSTAYFMRVFVRLNNLKIMAVRPIKRFGGHDETDPIISDILSTQSDTHEQVVWRTQAKGILYSGKTAVIEVHKPDWARYLGFGEQGGKQLLKSKVMLDYFPYDNMTYSQVYNKGPDDTREPLYHSEPFWLEIAQHPGSRVKVASFVDNYSQVCVDVGSKNNSVMRIATRFDDMRLCVVVGDSMSDLIQLYTSIVGRPRLKPRYVLGYHQGCYGYDTAKRVVEAVDGYRHAAFPLDGMHIDVDVQREYKTFTVNTEAFPDTANFFKDLRKKGVKCSTNITPFINGTEDPNYPTLNEALKNEYFVPDIRYLDENGPVNAHHDRYMFYNFGEQKLFRADDLSQEPRQEMNPPDNVELCTTWNTGQPYRGGVYYGNGRGKPGHYPNLNRADVRIWWGEQYRLLISLGLEFVWQDMTSPCMGAAYGDMKCFPFRLLLSSDGDKTIPESEQPPAPAIEIWALYAYNLHKATYKGLNKLPDRAGKRNFIIGRGGFIGLHRYAGLWHGDNSSDWDFLRVSVGQVLSLGLSGITISGGDVGGFEPSRHEKPEWQKWADPELLMRWYCAYTLLPWFRNHYIAKGEKLFQEPYRYTEVINTVPDKDKWLYRSTLPVCRYFVNLRYTLLQLLYDQMFDNLMTGLPIARCLIIRHEHDASLVTENTEFLNDEYMVGDDLLVAPVLHPQDASKYTRTAYLPRSSSWWQCNLRAGGPDVACKLEHEFEGGSLVPCKANLSESVEDLPLMTPMFIKAGGIIPQIEPRMSTSELTVNPISVHIYPGYHGLNRFYSMYLDDGVSRKSAPTYQGLQEGRTYNPETQELPEVDNEVAEIMDGLVDEEAGNVYWRVQIYHGTSHDKNIITREIEIKTIHKHPEFDPTTINGEVYRLMVWGEPQRKESFREATITTKPSGIHVKMEYDADKNAWLMEVPICDVAKTPCRITCSYNA